MRIYKNTFLAIVFLFSLSTVSAQYENTSGQKKQQKKKENVAKVNRWFAGGMIGGGFSSGGGGYIELSPLVGYKVTPDFHVGTRITYIFSSYRNNYSGSYNQSHTYGASLLARYVFLRFLYAQAEFEVLSFNHYYAKPEGERYTLTNLYLGGGYYQSFGKGFSSIGIFYNVLEDPNYYYPYSNPVIRISFGIGF
ncbi:MAG: hypothetical protein DRI89_08920 [Bacteroidetes bacterium]|nr:MAG: hypothetical protein DRI89_08920 [Bacteroidota bacterium]